MPLWILADAHGGADREADRDLLALFDAAKAHAADVLILGDLFAAWLAEDRFFTPFQAELVAKIRALRATGRRCRFVVGNRDYLIEDQLGVTFDQVIAGGALVDLGGVPTWVEHGDLLNDRDRHYRRWHRFSRHPLAGRFLRSLPPRAALALARRTETAMRGVNKEYKTGALPMPALERLGRLAMERGARRALVGHFHHDRVLDVPRGVPVVVAPAWLDHRRILVVEDGGALRSTVPPRVA